MANRPEWLSRAALREKRVADRETVRRIQEYLKVVGLTHYREAEQKRRLNEQSNHDAGTGT